VLPPLGVLAGLGFIAFGAQVIRAGRRLRASGHRVPGVVVRLRWDRREHSGQFYPVLRFQAAGGTVIETMWLEPCAPPRPLQPPYVSSQMRRSWESEE
jgi:hypothetical protein